MTVNESIERFFRWIENRRNEIDKFSDDYNYRTILLVSLIDTLSKCAFPELKNKNRERFVKLIDTYYDWDDKNRVSLPELSSLLKNCPEKTKCRELEKEVEVRLSNWEYGVVHPARNVDPLADELKAIHVCCNNEIIEKARYASILWKLRNFVMHEHRNPYKDGFGIAKDCEYMGSLSTKSGIFVWELKIPVEVISEIAKKCSENLKTYFNKEQKNPYNSFGLK